MDDAVKFLNLGIRNAFESTNTGTYGGVKMVKIDVAALERLATDSIRATRVVFDIVNSRERLSRGVVWGALSHRISGYPLIP